MTQEMNINPKLVHQSGNRIEILKYNKKLLSVLMLWPDKTTKWYHIKDSFHWITTLPLIIPIIIDIYMSSEEPNFNFEDITENCIEIATIVTAAYMLILFKKQKHLILNVIERLENLQKYHENDNSFLIETEESTRKLSKYFFYFVFWTNPLYAMIPLWNRNNCMKYRYEHFNENTKQHFGAFDVFPCGLDFKSRFPYDITTSMIHYWFWEFCEYYCSVVTTVCGVLLTTFMCSVLIYFIAEIKNLKIQILHLCDSTNYKNNYQLMFDKVCLAIDYHVQIIECTKLMNEAFGPILFMHFIITGISISILAVNILSQPLRYTAEILGWILILFLPSTFGQHLINESEDIANVAYNSQWYEAPIEIQKRILFIIVASRRTLCLQSMNYGIFCHSTFIMVLKSAYSFFTLMVQHK